MFSVTLPDGKQVAGESWRTTPYDVALGISKGLADNTVVARVDGELWDLDRPLEKDVKLELVKFDDEEGQAVFWHRYFFMSIFHEHFIYAHFSCFRREN